MKREELLKGVVNNPDYDQEINTSGDGAKDCESCDGSGFIQVPSTLYPEFKRCPCTYKKDLYKNLERGWIGLAKADKIEESFLSQYTTKNLWVSGSRSKFRSLLRRTAIEKGASWNFKVFSDAELMETWLANLIIKDQDEIIDPDVRNTERHLSHVSINELASTYSFLVIVLGTKSAANKEMPNVLMETLKIRFDKSKPTWIFDGTNPLTYGHISFSEKLLDFLEEEWDHKKIKLGESEREIKFDPINPSSKSEKKSIPATINNNQMFVLNETEAFTTKRIDKQEATPKKSKAPFKRGR